MQSADVALMNGSQVKSMLFIYIALNHSTDVPEPYPDCSGPGDCVCPGDCVRVPRGCGCPGDRVLRGCVRGYPCARVERCR